MLEQFFKSQVATVSDPYQGSRITDALAAAGIKFYCKTKDVNRRNTVRSGKNWNSRYKTKVYHRDICRQRKCRYGTAYCTHAKVKSAIS